jgi:hypothetical protein
VNKPASRGETLQARRAALHARAAALRGDFGRHVQVLQPPLAAVDRVRGGLAWLSRHPVLPAAAFGLIALLATRRRRRRAAHRRAVGAAALGIGATVVAAARWSQLGRWAARAWWAWRMARTGLRTLQASRARRPR